MIRHLRMHLFVVLALFSLVAIGQNTPAQNTQDTMSPSSTASQTVTGCLQKGQEATGYYLSATDGKIWELTGTTGNLSEHVGHQVAVTGSATTEPKAKEQQIGSQEKKESAGKEHGDLRVADVKMVSETCK